MYYISVEGSFSAAHYLRGYQGKCESLHGHRFKVVARLRLPGLNETGLAYDFSDLKKQLAAVLLRYDHSCLNDVEPFNHINPTSENIAATVYRQLSSEVTSEDMMDSVEVWESPESCAVYKPG